MAAEAECPVCEIRLREGDRFLLYTDGVVEPEKAADEEFSRRLLAEIRNWQPATATQQDDITLIVIDVVA